MTSGDRGAPARVVVTVDLRGGAPGPADFREARSLVDRTLREHGLDAADSSRVLIVGDAPELPRRIEAFDRVRGLAGFGPTLHLLFGEPAGDGAAGAPDPWVLRHPVLSTHSGQTGVIWAGSTRGIGFQPGRDGIQSMTGPDRDQTAEDELIQILALPPVFDRVLEQLAGFAAPIACLGLHVVKQDVPDGQVVRSLAQAARRLTRAGEGRPRAGRSEAAGPVAKDSLLAMLSGASTPDLAGLPTRTEYGRFALTRELCADRIAEADRVALELRAYRSVLGGDRESADEAMAEAGRALAEYRTTLSDALLDIDGALGLDQDAYAQLKELGVVIPPLPDVDVKHIDAALRREVLEALDQRVPMDRIADHLVELAGRTAPAGAAPHIDRVERDCPAALLERLITPRSITGRRPAARDLALAFVSAALAGLWAPFGPAVAPLVAAAATAAAVYGEPQPPRGRRGSVARAYGAAGLIGAVAGAAAGFLAHPAAALGAAALAFGVGAGIWQCLRRWTTAVDAWAARKGIRDAERAMEKLDRILEQAVRDWTLANAKLHASDSARALAGVVGRLADALDSGVAGAGPRRPAASFWDGADHDLDDGFDDELEAGYGEAPDAGRDGPAGGGRAVKSADLSNLLVRDLSDIVAELLDDYLQVISAEPERVAGLKVESDVRALLDRLRDHQRRNGIAAAPDFLRRTRSRPRMVRLAGFDTSRIMRAIAVRDTSPSIRQLCTAEQLCMLNRDIGVSRWVRFAHESVGEEARADERSGALTRSGAGRGDSVLWLGSGRYAGSLRLTPLASGASAPVRATGPADPSGGAKGAAR